MMANPRHRQVLRRSDRSYIGYRCSKPCFVIRALLLVNAMILFLKNVLHRKELA